MGPRMGEKSGREAQCKGPCSHFNTCSLMVEAGLGAWGSPREKGMGREGEERSGGERVEKKESSCTVVGM